MSKETPTEVEPNEVRTLGRVLIVKEEGSPPDFIVAAVTHSEHGFRATEVERFVRMKKLPKKLQEAIQSALTLADYAIDVKEPE